MTTLETPHTYSTMTFQNLEDKIITEYQKLRSLRKVKEKFMPGGPSHETIAKILKDNKIPIRAPRSYEKLTEEEKEQMVNSFDGNNIKELSEQYKLHTQTIIKILRKYGKEPKPQRKYPINEHAFDTINPDSAYWLGYLYGRNTIKDNNRLDVIFSNEIHREKVEKLKQFLGYDKPITKMNLKIGNKEYSSYRLVIGSKTLISKLLELGVGPTSTIKYPKFLNGNDEHFIHGYCDAKRNLPKDYIRGNKEFLAEMDLAKAF